MILTTLLNREAKLDRMYVNFLELWSSHGCRLPPGILGQFGSRTRHHLFLSFNACSIAGAASVSDPEWRRDSGASPSTMRILSSAKIMAPRRVADFFQR